MFNIRLDGDTQRLMKKLRQFAELDKKGINEVLGAAMRESTLERFKQSKDPQGKRWRTSIRAADEGGKTLVKSAQLRNSIRVKADATGFAVGTNVIYASTHQLGAKGRTIRAKTAKGLRFCIGDRWVTAKKVRVDIPARPFLGLSEDDMKEIKATLEDELGKE